MSTELHTFRQSATSFLEITWDSLWRLKDKIWTVYIVTCHQAEEPIYCHSFWLKRHADQFYVDEIKRSQGQKDKDPLMSSHIIRVLPLSNLHI